MIFEPFTKIKIIHLRCLCKPDFTGKNCEFPIGICDFNPSQNRGNCKMSNTTNFISDCPTSYGRERCEYLNNPCDLNPCQNGAKFFNIAEKVKCQFTLGYNEFCELHEVKCKRNECSEWCFKI